MEKNNIGSLMDVTMNKMREMVDVDTIVGSPITTPDGITIIPVSKVSYGFASGGSDFTVKEKNGFGGGNGAGIKIDPIGFLIVKDGGVRMISVTPPASTTIDRAIEKAPEFIDMVDSIISKYVDKKNAKETQE